MVANCDVHFSIKLEALQEEHKKIARCHFEPELFPGLIYKMENPKVVLLIFTSGKIVLTGGKSRYEIYTAFQKIYPVLYSFQKKKGQEPPTRKTQPPSIAGLQQMQKIKPHTSPE